MFIPTMSDDYTRNKADPNAIVSSDEDEKPRRFCADVFDSPEHFREVKKASDENYHKIHLNNRYFFENTLPLDWFEHLLSTESQEEAEAERKRIHELYLQVDRTLKQILSRKQYRRYKMYVECGMTEREIAKAENADISSICVCIARAKREIKKFFRENL